MERGSVRGGAEGRKGRDKLTRICACGQVSAKKEEGGGRREEGEGRRKANGKVCASKQVSTLSLFKAFFYHQSRVSANET